MRTQNRQQITGGLAQAGVYRRRKCSGNMNVCVPHERYRTPRLRQAARTLAASGENDVERVASRKETITPTGIESRKQRKSR